MSQVLNVKDQIMHPSGKWFCEECGKPIFRNVARTTDGRAHHWGCLKRGHAKPAWHCLQCGAELTRSQVVKVFIGGIYARTCGVCGGSPIEPYRNYARSFEAVHPGRAV